jgi:hypothetical protein
MSLALSINASLVRIVGLSQRQVYVFQLTFAFFHESNSWLIGERLLYFVGRDVVFRSKLVNNLSQPDYAIDSHLFLLLLISVTPDSTRSVSLPHPTR